MCLSSSTLIIAMVLCTIDHRVALTIVVLLRRIRLVVRFVLLGVETILVAILAYGVLRGSLILRRVWRKVVWSR